MKLEEIKNKTNEAVSYLVAALESGQSEVLTQYLNAMARFHNYSFGNIMLIARQKPQATQRCRHSHLELAWPLRETRRKRHLILAPMVGRKKRTDEIATEIESRQCRRRTQARAAALWVSCRVRVRCQPDRRQRPARH